MNSLDIELEKRLGELGQQGLFRELRRVDSPQSARIQIKGRTLLNFSSNDYLGLAEHPSLKEAAIRAVEKYGAGSGASRLVCGSLLPHHELEVALADFKKCPAALSFSSGYAAAIGTICALVGKGDIIVIDKLVHACIVDAAWLSGAKLRVFAHNDIHSLEYILQWAQKFAAASTDSNLPRTLIVTESVFSMVGDVAPLKEIAGLKERYGAWLMVDEAHATGLFGQNRRGVAEEQGMSDKVEIQMGTLGKALGSSGGFVCGSKMLINYLVNRARSFIFSTAPPPAVAAASVAGIKLVQSGEGAERCGRLWKNIRLAHDFLTERGWDLGESKSAILPLLIGDEAKAVQAFDALHKKGIFIPAIRYPTVSRGKARLRLTLTSEHSGEDLEILKRSLESIKDAV